MDHTFLGVLTGNDPDGPGVEVAIKKAVAERFKAIRSTFRMRNGDYEYGGNRCEPDNLGWRFLQNCRIGFDVTRHRLQGRKIDPETITVEGIAKGDFDTEIQAAWHEAASAEHWYMYEKDWGYGPGAGPFGMDD